MASVLGGTDTVSPMVPTVAGPPVRVTHTRAHHGVSQIAPCSCSVFWAIANAEFAVGTPA